MTDEPNNIINALARKLFIKPESQWLIFHPPAGYLSALQPLPLGASVSFEPAGTFDGIQLFVMNSAALATDLEIINPLLKADTIIWVSYPKKSSGIESDLEMTGSWNELAKYGLTVVAAAAINETWTAVRLKRADLIKRTDVSNDAIKQNEFAQYIDPDKKTVTPPADLLTALEDNPAALTYYRTLSYSNRKEYVLWVLTAKQEKTRNERVLKSIEKLLAGKKNPTEK
jgi:hypothetical protein